MSKLTVIDDNAIELFMMERIFKRYGLFPNTQFTSSAKDVLNFIITNLANTDLLPDIIFLDLNMPGFNGWDFLAKIDSLCSELKKKIDIYIISSSIDPNDRLQVKSYAIVKDFICKPIASSTLANLDLYYHPKH